MIAFLPVATTGAPAAPVTLDMGAGAAGPFGDMLASLAPVAQAPIPSLPVVPAVPASMTGIAEGLVMPQVVVAPVPLPATRQVATPIAAAVPLEIDAGSETITGDGDEGVADEATDEGDGAGDAPAMAVMPVAAAVVAPPPALPVPADAPAELATDGTSPISATTLPARSGATARAVAVSRDGNDDAAPNRVGPADGSQGSVVDRPAVDSRIATPTQRLPGSDAAASAPIAEAGWTPPPLADVPGQEGRTPVERDGTPAATVPPGFAARAAQEDRTAPVATILRADKAVAGADDAPPRQAPVAEVPAGLVPNRIARVVPTPPVSGSPVSADIARRADDAPADAGRTVVAGPAARVPAAVATTMAGAAVGIGPAPLAEPAGGSVVPDGVSVSAATGIDLDAIFPSGADTPLTIAFARPLAGARPEAMRPETVRMAGDPAVAGGDPVMVDAASAIDAPMAGNPVALTPTPLVVAEAKTTGSAIVAAPAETVIQHHLDVAHDGAWLDRLARDIAASADKDMRMRFQLNPERLGSLHVEIARQADGAAVRFSADSEAARALIADAQPRLIAEARAQGMRIADTQVDLSGQGGLSQGGGFSAGAGANPFAQQQQQQQAGQQRAPAFDRPATAMTRPALAGPADRAAARAERYA